MKTSRTFIFSASLLSDLKTLQKKLDYKVENISQGKKEILGYYYLSNLIDTLPNLRLNNYVWFHRKLQKIVHQFPVSNNGYTRYDSYLNDLGKFRKEVRKELGLVQKNYLILRRSIEFFTLGLFLGVVIYLTHGIGWALVGLALAYNLGIIIGFYSEYRLKKSNRILYNKKK